MPKKRPTPKKRRTSTQTPRTDSKKKAKSKFGTQIELFDAPPPAARRAARGRR